MKKLIRMVVLLCCAMAVSPAFADEWEGLSRQARESVQLQVGEMSALGIPEMEARQMLTGMVRNRFTEQNMDQARRMVMDAARAGLPTEAIMSEAMRGMARQAREQEVIAAMATVRDRYTYADRMARSLATEPRRIETMRTAMVDCLATGMRPADLEAVRERLQVQSQTRTRNKAEDEALAVQTMLTAATMNRRGVRSPEIADVLGRALQQQYTYREMEQLRQRFANRSMQESPRETAARHAASIGRGEGAGPAAGPGAGSGGQVGGNAGGGNSGGGNAGNSGGQGGGNAGGSNGGGGNAGGSGGR